MKTVLEKKMWQTATGKTISISDMSTTHIINSIKKIKSSTTGWRSDWLPYLEAELKSRNLISETSKDISKLIPSDKEQVYFLNTSCGYTSIKIDKIINELNKNKISVSDNIKDYLDNSRYFIINDEKISEKNFIEDMIKDIKLSDNKIKELELYQKYEKFKLENVFTKEWRYFIDLMLGRK